MAEKKGIIAKLGWFRLILIIVAISIILTYFAWGLDLIPDATPWLGYLDDAAIIVAVVIAAYKVKIMTAIKK